MKLLFSICFVAIFLVNLTFGCTLAGKSLSDFDATEYIFIGEVTGYTEPTKSAKLRDDAYGLVVKINESVYLPKTPNTHFEIFPIQLYSDCSFSGTQIDKLKREFPIGSEIRVIGKEAEILPNNLSDGNVRLEDRPDESGSIALNNDRNKNRMTSTGSVFDYNSFKYDINKDSESKYLLPCFEIRKDLFRLKNSLNQKERKGILSRLKQRPIYCDDLDFNAVFKKYSPPKK